MQKWDILTPLGIGLGCTIIFLAISMGSNVGVFLSLSGFLITVGGSFCALMVNYKWEQVIMVFKILKKLIFSDPVNQEELTDIFIALARKSRKEGILALEDDIELLDDRFFQKGLRLVVDAIDIEHIKEILATDMHAAAFRHQISQGLFRTWGGFCPAFGMMGTLIGLIQMLSKLNDPSALGPSMALALVTTFYGVLLANLVFIPIAGKLELLSEEEYFTKQIILDGLIAIQGGMNPRILGEKLGSYLRQENGKEESESNVF